MKQSKFVRDLEGDLTALLGEEHPIQVCRLKLHYTSHISQTERTKSLF
jgi:hypothetical protein